MKHFYCGAKYTVFFFFFNCTLFPQLFVNIGLHFAFYVMEILLYFVEILFRMLLNIRIFLSSGLTCESVYLTNNLLNLLTS